VPLFYGSDEQPISLNVRSVHQETGRPHGVRQTCRRAIITISTRRHRDVGRERLRRSSWANIGPNFKTHRRWPHATDSASDTKVQIL